MRAHVRVRGAENGEHQGGGVSDSLRRNHELRSRIHVADSRPEAHAVDRGIAFDVHGIGIRSNLFGIDTRRAAFGKGDNGLFDNDCRYCPVADFPAEEERDSLNSSKSNARVMARLLSIIEIE